MTEREFLLNATAVLLLIGLLSHRPAIMDRLGRSGCGLLVAGSLIPLLDPLIAYVSSEDQLALLMHQPFFLAPFYGGLVILFGASLAAFLVGARRARTIGVGLAAGYGLQMALLMTTQAGVPLFEPFAPGRVRLPMLPVDHLPLLGVLIAGLVALELFPRRNRWIWPGTMVLVGFYLAFGGVASLVVYRQAVTDAHRKGSVHVYPLNAWLTRWAVVDETPEAYRFQRRSLTGGAPHEADRLERWNNQPLMLKLLGDPVVRRFYYQIFHHPVVRIEISGSQVTLLMQELEDLSPQVPGRTFYLETDLTGHNRFYQIQRFD